MTKRVSITRNFVVYMEQLLLLRYHDGWTCRHMDCKQNSDRLTPVKKDNWKNWKLNLLREGEL
jgi:hypothetical protein